MRGPSGAAARSVAAYTAKAKATTTAASNENRLSMGTPWVISMRSAARRHSRFSVALCYADSTAACRLDRGDVDLPHRHHRVERSLLGGGVGVGDGLRQGDGRDLPRHAPPVLAPAARVLLAAVADNRVPVAVRFRLVGRRELERERFGLLE